MNINIYYINLCIYIRRETNGNMEFAQFDLSCVEVNSPSCLTFLQWTTEQYLIGIISRIANRVIASMGVP